MLRAKEAGFSPIKVFWKLGSFLPARFICASFICASFVCTYFVYVSCNSPISKRLPMSVKRRPMNRTPLRHRRSNKICFNRIRREVHTTSQAVLILRPAGETAVGQALLAQAGERRGVLKGEG